MRATGRDGRVAGGYASCPCVSGSMFDLSLMDHLRLTFGYVVYRQKAHADLARTRARWSRASKGAQAVLMLAVAIPSVPAALASGSPLPPPRPLPGGPPPSARP